MKAAIARFKRFLKNRYPNRSTTKHYMSDLSIFTETVGDVPPETITSRDIDAFVQAQSAQGLQAATINRRISTLSSFFEFLIGESDDNSLRNPVHWKRHSIRPGHRLPRDVSDETVNTLLNATTDSRDRAMFTLMVSAGLRVGEIVELHLRDLPPLESSNVARLRVRGKGDKERIVWLTGDTQQQIQRWLQQRPQTESSHLFLNQHGRPLSVAGVQFRLKQACERAGVELTCHQLRHTYARRLVEHNMPIDSLAKLLGHNDLRTTQRYIDGADPTVRTDFLQAMQQIDQAAERATLPTETAPGRDEDATPFAPSHPDERPDPTMLVDNLRHLAADLPVWLQDELRLHTIRRIPRWQPHRAKAQTHMHFSTLCRISRWLVTHRHWQCLDQLQRADLVAYVTARSEADIKPRSIAAELTVFRIFWRDLLTQEKVTNGTILRVKAPPAGEHLPRYLTVTEYQRLEQIVQTATAAHRPKDRFNRAWFYLFAHAGLRKSEVLNLRLGDCDLNGQRLRVQSGKGNRDRVIPLTPHLVSVLQAYLTVREPSAADHLLIYKGAPVKPHLLPDRLRAFGRKADIESVTPHRLRHTFATFLINQGMPITSLQKLLGHQDINKTLIYARVFDETVRAQFASATTQMESIPLTDWTAQFADPSTPVTVSADEICDSV